MIHPYPLFARRQILVSPILLAFIAVGVQPALCLGASRNAFDIREFGAVGDGETPNTQAIQKAIDACAESGGGRVYFPPGRFVSGTLFLKDRVALDLDQGAVLLGSPRLEDYPTTHCEFPSFTDKYCVRALIWGEGLENIGLVGRGTIDGQGAAFLGINPSEEELAKRVEGWNPNRHVPQTNYINRPYLIRFVSCREVLVEGLKLRNSAMWMQHYLNCDFVTLRGLNVYNHCNGNNDMIDIDCCRDVLISDCYGDSDDDALTLKSTADRPTENVTVTNCVLSSHCNALKMGTESNGGFKNIAISNCVIRPSRDRDALAGIDEGLAGIALEIVDGGSMDGIAISNISIVGQRVPIFIRLGNRARPLAPVAEKPSMGSLRNVVLSNIVSTQTGHIGCSITGLPGYPVENVTLDNIRIEYGGGVRNDRIEPSVPELPEEYPESGMFGVLPAYGFYCRHVKGLTFRNFDLGYAEPDNRPALFFEDVQDLFLDRMECQSEESTLAQIVLRKTQGTLISGCRPHGNEVFLRLEGPNEGVSVVGNDFTGVTTPVSLETEALKEAVFEGSNRTK